MNMSISKCISCFYDVKINKVIVFLARHTNQQKGIESKLFVATYTTHSLSCVTWLCNLGRYYCGINCFPRFPVGKHSARIKNTVRTGITQTGDDLSRRLRIEKSGLHTGPK